MKRSAFLIIMIVFMIGSSGFLVRAEELSLEQVVAMSLETSESVQIKQEEVVRKGAEYREAKSVIYPHLSADASWSHNAQYPKTSSLEDYVVGGGISATQLIWSFGKVSSAIKAAEDFLDVARFDQETVQADVVYSAKVAFYSALLAQRTYGITERSLENAKVNKDILMKRSASGRVAKYDNIKASSDIASRILQVSNARIEYKKALRFLNRSIGRVLNEPIEFTGGFDLSRLEKNTDEYQTQMLENESSLKSLKAVESMTRRVVSYNKAQALPEISAFSSWSVLGQNTDVEVGLGPMDDTMIVGLKVSVPIWNGGERKHQLEQAKSDERISKMSYLKRERDLLLDIDNAIVSYQGYLETLEANRESVQLAEESFKYSQDLFEAGQVSLTDLNDTEQLLMSQLLNLDVTKYNMSMALAKIERLAGTEGGE